MSAHPQVLTRSLGRLRIHAIQAAGQKLDGGAMFGVVPKPLWERRIPADERNRIALGMRCLLVEHPDGLVLVDTGVGNKENEKFRDIYGIENASASGDATKTWLDDGLASLGFAAEEVRVVINTHLHFDHAGGNTRREADGSIRPSFPQARYIASRGEHHWATHTNERTAASYFGANWEPVLATKQLELRAEAAGILPGIRALPSPGHTPHHWSILVDGGDGAVACFLGDVCPTASHLPLPWIMGYDVEPLVTMESKRHLLAKAVAEEWLLVFEHDVAVPWGRAVHDGKGYALGDAV